MAAQSCNHRPWDAVHLESFMNYWGHAARMDPELLRPIQRVLQVRDQEWMERHPEIRRRMGRWPNAPFGLTLLWRRCRLAGDPVWWEDMAHSRDRWKQFTDEVFHIKGILKDRFYADLHHVDLCGRCLLRTGDRFWLLPQTHPPIDPPYPSSFQHVPHTEEATEAACFCVACDGSRKGVHLGLGVAILPPYGSFPQDVVVFRQRGGGSPATNIRAELLAATKALEMCLQILEKFPGIPVMLLTDSAYVLQVLEGGGVGFAHVSLQAGLCMLWHRCSDRVILKHVKAHTGHALNETADSMAKSALDMPPNRFAVRTLDATRACLPIGAGLPLFTAWWT